jgi:pimeloyl-ACP methyl ester carboxylesterase
MEELRLAGFREPLGLWMRRVPPPEPAPHVRAYRLEFSSRGDRVSGRLWLPRNRAGESPLILLQPPGESAAETVSLERVGGAWTERGVAVATIDLPLRGARSDPKLSGLVGTPFEPGSMAEATPLRFELARQAIVDLERVLDAACSLDAIDRDRIAFVGLGLGALLGAAFCALDPRPRAAALVGAGAGLAARAVDPGTYIGRFAPKPLLLLGATEGPPDRQAAEALRAAAGDPVEQRWLDGSPDLESSLASCWDFLATALRLEPRSAD